MSVRRVLALVLLAAATSVVAGCDSDDDGETENRALADHPLADYENPPMHARVEITSKGYRPKHVRVLVGGTVTFVNVDPDQDHTAETEDLPEGPTDNNEFDTHTLTWEEPYTVTFHKPETVTYSSSFDSWMKGKVTAVRKIDLSAFENR